jgi:hypothetical protein
MVQIRGIKEFFVFFKGGCVRIDLNIKEVVGALINIMPSV